MKKLLVVVDMQNDFITGCLGNEECRAVVPYVADRIAHFDGDVVFTLDTHHEDYLQTQEGKMLPVTHCVKGSRGWELIPELAELSAGRRMFEKNTFGSTELAEWIRSEGGYGEAVLVGVCTDICVISNAMVIKAFNPELPITVDAKGCAGVSPASHDTALEAMKSCQIHVAQQDD